jgi:hypothetical protein
MFVVTYHIAFHSITKPVVAESETSHDIVVLSIIISVVDITFQTFIDLVDLVKTFHGFTKISDVLMAKVWSKVIPPFGDNQELQFHLFPVHQEYNKSLVQRVHCTV